MNQKDLKHMQSTIKHLLSKEDQSRNYGSKPIMPQGHEYEKIIVVQHQ